MDWSSFEPVSPSFACAACKDMHMHMHMHMHMCMCMCMCM